jgi:hypothetical protein
MEIRERDGPGSPSRDARWRGGDEGKPLIDDLPRAAAR